MNDPNQSSLSENPTPSQKQNVCVFDGLDI